MSLMIIENYTKKYEKTEIPPYAKLIFYHFQDKRCILII